MAKRHPEQMYDDLVSNIYVELDRSVAYSSQALRENRRKAWNYYLNRPRGDEIEGRSKVQDTSVRDTVHALMAQIMPAYATDSIAHFEPIGPDDLNQAEAESESVNAIFTETNQGYLELYNSIQDCLLFRNGIMKVWVDDVEDVTTRSFAAPAADVLAQAPPDEDWEHMGTEDGLSTFRIKRNRQRLQTSSVEPSHFFVNPNQEDQNLQDTDFMAELVYYRRSELVEMGIKRSIVDELPANTSKNPQSSISWSNSDITAKYVDGQVDVHQAATADRALIECYWIHMTIDRDNDGISEKYRFLVAHRTILLDEPVEFFPYASGAAWPVPHRWSALSVYDLLRHTQDERTNARRQLHDNLNVANNQRPIYDPGKTQQADVNAGAPGRGIRSTDPGNVGFVPVQDITSNSISFLTYTDKVRSEQTGAALEMASAEGQLVREASGVSVDMQLQPREQMAAMVSRNIAETLVRNVFLLIHRTLRTQWKGIMLFKKADDWQETNPAEWQARDRINITVGLSPGERRRTMQALQYVHQVQMQMIAGGTANITTDWPGIHKSLTDWMRAAELDTGQQYFLDPDGQKSMQAQQAAAQEQQAQAQQGQQMQQLALQMQQMESQLEKLKLDQEDRHHQDEMRFKYYDADLDANIEVEKLESAEATAERASAESTATTGSNGRAAN